MEALNYLNEIVNNKYCRVPDALATSIVAAGLALGLIICGGYYDPATDTRALYID